MEETRLQYTRKEQPVVCKQVDRTSDYVPRIIHAHHGHELCLVSSPTRFQVWSGGQKEWVQGPALLFHRAHCYHELLQILPGPLYQSTVAHYHPELLATPDILRNHDCVILPLQDEEAGAILRYFSLIPEEPTERQLLAVQLALSRIKEILAQGRGQFLRTVDSYIFELLQYIREHPEEKLTIDSLSVRFHVSATKLKQDFSRLTGSSVGRFLTHQRLLLSRELLRTDAPLAHIALQCGFCSQSHFISAFRAEYGITPGAFRKEEKQNV